MIVDIYITCKDKKDASKIAKALLLRKLAGCVTIFPIQSMYWWEGTLQTVKEVAMLVKAPKKNQAAIEKAVKRLHSYTTPCIISFFPAHVNKDYERWINEVTR